VAQLARGCIVWLEGALDPQGGNPKERAFVIVTATEEIKEGEPFFGVAITGEFDKPLGPECVMMPWSRPRHPRTGLSKECVAKCDWIHEFHHGDPFKLGGFVPGKQLLEILDKLDAMPE
jgi:hypothetical protein